MGFEAGNNGQSKKKAFPFRLLLHAILAVLGWILFAYFWRIVTAVGLSPGARMALFAMSVFVVILLASTTWWILHNRRIGRRNRRNSLVAPGGKPPTVDTTGLAIEMPDPESLRAAQIVEITIDDSAKRYRPISQGDNRAPSQG